MEQNVVLNTSIYDSQFSEVVSLIRQTHTEVLQVANKALIELHWKIGAFVSKKISSSEWGDGVVKQLALFIERSNPGIKGFSDKNIWRMKRFYEIYYDADEKLSPLVRQISWTNNLTIMSRAKSQEESNESRFSDSRAIIESFSHHSPLKTESWWEMFFTKFFCYTKIIFFFLLLFLKL